MKIVRLNHDTKHFCNQLEQVRELITIPTKVDAFIDNLNNIAYLAIDNDQVIGFVWGYVLERLDNEPMLYIHSVDVIESYRRQGVAKVILKEFLTILKKEGYRNMFLITDADNVAANKLYESLGGELEKDKNLYIFK